MVARLVNELERMVREDDETPAPFRCAQVLTSLLAEPVQRVAMLDEWLSGVRSAVPYQRGRSQLHNNGFSKISLAKFGSGWHVRLHIWWGRGGDNRIHDHRWSFVSFVLIGSLDAVNYTDIAGVAPTECYRLADAVGNGEKAMERTAPRPLAPSASYRVSAGDYHCLQFDQPHIVAHDRDTVAATLMVSAPPSREFSHSFGPRPRVSTLPAPRPIADEDAIAEVEKLRMEVAQASVRS